MSATLPEQPRAPSSLTASVCWFHQGSAGVGGTHHRGQAFATTPRACLPHPFEECVCQLQGRKGSCQGLLNRPQVPPLAGSAHKKKKTTHSAGLAERAQDGKKNGKEKAAKPPRLFYLLVPWQ